MPKTDDEGLDPVLERQLRAALDEVKPRFSAPRYGVDGPHAWRLAPVALAIAVTGVLALSLSAATGSVNPAVVMNRISTAIEPALEPSSTPTPSPEESPKAVVPAPPPHEATSPPEPRESPEPAEHPEPAPSSTASSPSPEPGDDHSAGSSPSPSPGDH